MLLAGKVVEVLHYQPQYELRSISVAVWTTLRTIIILPPDPSHITDYKEVNRMRGFFKENWLTIVLASATTIAVRLLLGL